MKTVIKILGIVLGILSILGGVICLIFGLVCAANVELLREMLQGEIPAAELERFIPLILAIYICGGIEGLIGAVFCFVHAGFAGNTTAGRGAGIVLGVFGILFGAAPTGILTIVDSALHRR